VNGDISVLGMDCGNGKTPDFLFSRMRRVDMTPESRSSAQIPAKTKPLRSGNRGFDILFRERPHNLHVQLLLQHHNTS
jgi:hypothetical protein